MSKRTLFMFLLGCVATTAFGQNVCISADGTTPDLSAMLEVNVNSLASKKGMLVPRMTRAQRDAIAAPADGLLVYLTDAPGGFWYYDADVPAWLQWGASPWRTTGNAGTLPTHQFVGTCDAQPFVIRTNGSRGMRLTTLGQWVPESTGNSVLIGLDVAHGQVAYGNERNTYIGISAGFGNTVDPSTAALNTAAGPAAATYLATGNENAAVGYFAGRTNQFGSRNSFAGSSSDIHEVYDWHTHTALCALGNGAEASTHTTAVGARAQAGKATNGVVNFHGAAALGADAVADTLNSAALGSGCVVTDAHAVRIGSTAVNDIGGFAPWTDLSDIRFKQDVEPLEQGMDLIARLRPITYRVDRTRLDELLGARMPAEMPFSGIHTGFSAQDLESALVVTGAPAGMVVAPGEGRGHYGVNYAAMVPHLVKAVQERDAANAELARYIKVMEQRVSQLESHQR